MFIRTLNTRINKIRGIIQIIMTLISFFGFNEAVLAARYRNSLYISNFDARMTVESVSASEPAWLGYASSGDMAALVGDPGNLKYRESPLRLMEYALMDLNSSMGAQARATDKTIDVAIGIAGFDFFASKLPPKASELKLYGRLAPECTLKKRKDAYFKCMVRKIYQKHGWTVEKVVLRGDHELMVAAAQGWLEGKQKSAGNFDLIQATTSAVPYMVRDNEIVELSARLPAWLRQSGGYYDLGRQAKKRWFSGEGLCKPIHNAYRATDYMQEYGKQKGNSQALFNWWERSGNNSLGFQTARVTNDSARADYLSGSGAISASMYELARKDAQGLVNRVIEQIATIIRSKQDEYYQGTSERIWPIVIMGEFAADVLASDSNRQKLLQGLPEEDRSRVIIVPGNDFFYNLAKGGKRLLNPSD